MKKLLSITLSIIMLISMSAGFDLSAYAETSGDYEYTVLDDGTAEITNYTGSDTVLTIPSVIDNYTVTSIGSSAFSCSNIEKITIPDSVTSIGYFAFGECRELTDVVISGSITSIGNSVFYNCECLKNINIPEGVTSIGAGAFSQCSSLESIVIPASVMLIGDNAFYCCRVLTSILVDDNNQNYSSLNGVLFNKNMTELIKYPMGNARESYTIPDDVTCINSYAFEFCGSLTSITIPNSVTSINPFAFYFCEGLTNVTVPDSVTIIDNGAFGACSSLAEIIILNSNCEIYNHSLTISDTATIKGYAGSTAQTYAEEFNREFMEVSNSDNPGISAGDWSGSIIHTGECKVSLTKDMTSIDHQSPNAMYYEEAYVFIPDFSMTYEYSAMSNVTGNNTDTNVQLAVGVFDSNLNCLYQTVGDSSIDFKYSFEAGKTYFLANALQIVTANINVEDLVDGGITLSTTVDLNASDVENYLNSNCENDDPYNEGWKIGDEVYGLVRVYDDAVIDYIPNDNLPNDYSSRNNITSVIIPSKVDTDYSDGCFHNNTRITSVKIEYNSLKTYSNLRNIYLPYSIEWIESIYGGASGYEDLANVALKEINIPSSVKRIDGPAFNYCTALTNITIPESVESIGADAFIGCSSLTDVTILNSECDLDRNTIVFPMNQSITIHGYYGSTAQQHVKEMNYMDINYSFSPLENSTIKADELGASIRVSDAGLRFGFSYNEIQNYIGTQEIEIEEYGFVYAYYATDDLTVDGVGTNGVKQKVASNKTNHSDYTTFNLVFTNIPQSSFDTVVSARAYVKIDGECYYSDVLQRSYRQVANAVLVDAEIDNETKNAVREILGEEV